jgi:hypothetical protein
MPTRTGEEEVDGVAGVHEVRKPDLGAVPLHGGDGLVGDVPALKEISTSEAREKEVLRMGFATRAR